VHGTRARRYVGYRTDGGLLKDFDWGRIALGSVMGVGFRVSSSWALPQRRRVSKLADEEKRLRETAKSLPPGAARAINRRLRAGKIKLEEVERLNRAFAVTLHRLNLVDRGDPVCEIVARRVIDIDAAGTHDPEEIAKLAVKQLGFPDAN
jgi:hypothetical protein